MKWFTRLVLCLPLLVISCSSAVTPGGTPTVDEVPAVRAAFETYTKAIRERDGATALSVIASPVFKFYEEARALALTASEDKVAALPVVNRVAVYKLRAETGLDVLRGGKIQDIVKTGIDNGRDGVQGISDLGLGKVTVSGDQAMGEVISKGKVTPFQFSFVREDRTWKIDIEPLLELANIDFLTAAEKQGITVDELVDRLMISKYGKAKAAELHKPLVG